MGSGLRWAPWQFCTWQEGGDWSEQAGPRLRVVEETQKAAYSHTTHERQVSRSSSKRATRLGVSDRGAGDGVAERGEACG